MSVYTYTFHLEELLLEESPKWHLLSMVLDEIRKESKSNSEGMLCMLLFM